MNEEDNIPAEGAEFKRPEPDFNANPNVQARRRAGKRSANRNAGKPIDDGVVETPAPTEETPAEDNAGGIVAEAEKELEVAQEAAEEAAEGETPPAAEEAAEGEAPAEENKEPTAVEQFAAEEAEEPEHQGSDAIQQFAAEEAQEPQHRPVGEYTAPEGAPHDELIDQYHEALAFGDLELAKKLYHQLREHRFAENAHRTKSEAQAEREAQEYLSTAEELAAQHPELAVDGVESKKVLALSDVYRGEGLSAAQALRKAVEDLYPASPAPAPQAEAPAPAPVVEETPAPAEEAPAAEEPPVEEPMIPDMQERVAAKQEIPEMPSAAARNEPEPPKKAPTRSDAIQEMKVRRGQA